MTELLKDRYELLEKLGVGGAARVVKALDHQHGRLVALKIRAVGDARAREGFLAETRMLLAIAPHPALPLVRDDFFDGDDYIVAMDWVEGVDLATLLRDRGRPGLAAWSVLAYLAEAAEALMHLHHHDPPLIHGDVKPANLILTKGGKVKLVDFGMSSMRDVGHSRAGSSDFVAPELAAGGASSTASDVYGLAATALALLTGTPPTGDSPDWDGMDATQAGELEDAIGRGLAADPARRPATAAELVERLRGGWGATLPTGLLTFCFTDIEGSTAMWDTDPTGMADALVRHDELIAQHVESHGGHLIESMGEGDSTVSVFHSAPQAIEAAVAANRALAAERWPNDLAIVVRFGLHTGEAERRGTDYFGPTLNLAARVRGQADGKQIFLSSATEDLVAARLPDGCDLVDLGPHRLKGFATPERIWALRGPGVDAPRPVTDCPYRGLLAFEADDREFFFGREEVVDELLTLLAPRRLVSLVGASGSGKSSVLRAGIVAAVEAGEVAGMHRVHLLTPGVEPKLDIAGTPNDLLLVDQFEELFTLCKDAERRRRFIDAMLDFPGPVLIGVRADLYGQLSTHPGLARAVAGEQILLGPMTDAELRRAVTEPARLAGLRLAPGLVDLALRDVADEPGALPLLSHALRATWERRDGRTLTIEGYRESGGVASAVARTADALVDNLPAAKRPLARTLFLRLTELGEGIEDTRRRERIADLVPQGTSPEAVESLLEQLAAARLVTLGDGTAEVAHEVLIRHWPTLRRWLDEDREGLRLHRRLGNAGRLWAEGGREASDLYGGARLATALEWADAHPEDLNAAEREFLDESRAAGERDAERQRRANRRLRLMLAGAGLLLTAAVIAGAIAISERQSARSAARAEAAQRLGADALNAEATGRALQLANAGVALGDSVGTRGNLLTVLLRTPPAMLGVLGHADDAEIYAVAASPDGRLVAIGDAGGTVAVFDASSRQRLGEYQLGDASGGGLVQTLTFSPDGRTLAVTGHEPPDEPPGALLDLIDVPTLDRRARIVLPPYPESAVFTVANVAFLSAGELIVIQNPDRGSSVLRRVNVRTGELEGRPLPVGHVAHNGLFSEVDGRRVFVTSADGDETLEIDAQALRVAQRYPEGGDVGALSPDGRVLALGSGGGTVRLVDRRTGAVRRFTGRHQAGVLRLAFTPDGHELVSSARSSVIVWDIDPGEISEELSTHRGNVWGLAVSPDGRTLYSGGADARAIIWDLTGDRRLVRSFPVDRPFGVIDTPRGLALSPDGETLALTHSDGAVDLIDAQTLRRRASLDALRGFAAAVSFSPNGRLLAAAGKDGQITLWDARTLAPAGELNGLLGNSQALAFSPDGKLLAAAENTGQHPRMRIWNVRRRALTGFRSETLSASLAFSPDGRLIAAAALESGTEIRDPHSGALVKRLPAEGLSRSVAFSPDGSLLAVGHFDATGRIYSTETWEQVGGPLLGHTQRITYVHFSPDGRTLATASADGTVALWDVGSQQPIGSALTLEPNTFASVAFSPNDSRLFAVSTRGPGISLDTAPEAWRVHACTVAGGLTPEQWEEVVPEQEYVSVCPSG